MEITLRSSGFVRQTYRRDNPDENNLRICNPLLNIITIQGLKILL